MKFARVLFFALLLISTGAALTRGAWPRPGEPNIEVVGPSVLLNARDAGEVTVVDLRAKGRTVPGATKLYHPTNAPLFLLGEEISARNWARTHHVSDAFIIAPHMIEYHDLPGVPQLSPRVAREKVERDHWPLLDISEASEFQKSRLPRSQRFDYARFRAGNWSQLPRDKPFIIACRVGHRSQLVVAKLRKNGYDARNLNGGLWQWECDGLEVQR